MIQWRFFLIIKKTQTRFTSRDQLHSQDVIQTFTTFLIIVGFYKIFNKNTMIFIKLI